MTKMRDRVHRLGRRLGIDVVRYPGTWTPLGRRAHLLRAYGVDVVLDVGANTGQYGRQLREIGYKGRIVSFEPLPDAAAQLERVSERDSRWRVLRVALGESEGVALMNVAGNSVSSSLLPMLPSHEEVAPESKVVSTVEVQVQRLDDIFPDLLEAGERPFLKIDAQGYERCVLEGGRASLPGIVGLQVELSLVPLYAGAPAMLELIAWLDELGYRLMCVEPGFGDPRSGRLLQLDGVFFRDPAVASIGALSGEIR